MKKVIVIGCPGSGKSTFSRALNLKTGLPLHHLDMMKWKADKTTVTREVFLKRLHKVLPQDNWIIDGNYFSTMEMRIDACDTIIFLDYDTATCLNGIKSRIGQVRTDMPWIETEPDPDFIDFIKSYNTNMRPKVIALLEANTDKNIVHLENRNQADNYLASL